MDRKDTPLINLIARELKKGYWKSTDAARYAPMLFPMVKPEDTIRDAVSAILCHEDKEQKMKSLKSFIHKGKETQHILKDFDQVLSGNRDRLLSNKENDENSRNYRDIIMMLLATNMSSQKSTVALTADVTKLYSEVYSECDQCPLNKSCKQAFSMVTEYIADALIKLNITL